jgi:cytochrome c553
VPEPTGTGFVAVGSPGRPVTDAPLAFDVDGRERTKNYTVIQWSGTLGTFLLYADQVPLVAGYSPTAGDYWHLRVPWNNVPGSTPDAPNGQPALDPTGFNAQITAWCEACHSRYHGTTGSAQFPTSDPIFKYQHTTSGLLACTTCHVAHGSNASMDAEPTTPGLQGYSAGFPYPDNVYDPGPPSTNTSVSASSRLLKVDNRGTCQLCHDPTGTVANNTPTGPVPVPVVP